MQFDINRPRPALYLGTGKHAVISRGTKELPSKEIDDRAKASFAEVLLFAGSITLGIGGPNLQLVTLLRWLDITSVDRLIRGGTSSSHLLSEPLRT